MKSRIKIMRRIGHNIKELRVQQQISQGELAELLNVDRSLISKWERGLAPITADRMICLAEVLHVDISILYSDNCSQHQPKKDD